MRIFKYQQWLEESEEVAPAPAPAAEAVPTTDTLPEIPAEPIGDAPIEGDVPPAEPMDDAPIEGEGSEYDQIDIERKDAIRAFKAKYEEFKNAPEDQKEGMKEELKTLFDAMNAAVEKFDELVAKEIGADAAPEIDDEP
jgi:hypothetical protein